MTVQARVLDLIRRLNDLRRVAGLELTDRIVVTLPASEADLVERYGDWIAAEVLAVRIDTDSVEQPRIARAETQP